MTPPDLPPLTVTELRDCRARVQDGRLLLGGFDRPQAAQAEALRWIAEQLRALGAGQEGAP